MHHNVLTVFVNDEAVAFFGIELFDGSLGFTHLLLPLITPDTARALKIYPDLRHKNCELCLQCACGVDSQPSSLCAGWGRDLARIGIRVPVTVPLTV